MGRMNIVVLLIGMLIAGSDGVRMKDKEGAQNPGSPIEVLMNRPNDIVAKIPSVPDKATVEVYYAEVDLMGNKILGKMGGKHSGLTFKYEEDGNPKMWTVELWADQGLTSALCPNVDAEGNIAWKNEVVISFRSDTLDWSPNKTNTPKERLVGTIPGSVFKEYGEFIIEYLKEHPIYQPWDVTPETNPPVPDLAPQRILRSEVCDSFAQASITKLHSLAPEGFVKKPELKRNYQLLLSNQKELDRVDPENPELKAFMKKFSDACKGQPFQIVQNVLNILKKRATGEAMVFFVHTHKGDYKIPLAGNMVVPKYARMETPWSQA